MNIKMFVVYLLCLWVCHACSKKVSDDSFILSGKIGGCGSKVVISYQDTSGNRVWLPAEVQNESFVMELKLKEPQVVKVLLGDGRFKKKVGRGAIPCNSSYLMLVAMPGQCLQVKGTLKNDFVDIYPGGEQENDIFRKFTSVLHPLLNENVNLMLKNMMDTTLTMDEKQKNIERIKQYDKELQDIRIDFLDKHVSSIAGVWLLEDMLVRSQLSIGQAEYYLNQVDRKYAGSGYYKSVVERVQGAKATEVGQFAPMIRTMNTYDGKVFDLREWKGKYILLDFWGTWCGACIAGMPEMKKFAEKHADKLLLLGIAKESNRENWKKYLAKSEWNWKQIIVGEGDEDYIARFNVQGFPTKILIGPDGNILKRSVGEDPAFYEELEQLIK